MLTWEQFGMAQLIQLRLPISWTFVVAIGNLEHQLAVPKEQDASANDCVAGRLKRHLYWHNRQYKPIQSTRRALLPSTCCKRWRNAAQTAFIVLVTQMINEQARAKRKQEAHILSYRCKQINQLAQPQHSSFFPLFFPGTIHLHFALLFTPVFFSSRRAVVLQDTSPQASRAGLYFCLGTRSRPIILHFPLYSLPVPIAYPNAMPPPEYVVFTRQEKERKLDTCNRKGP